MHFEVNETYRFIKLSYRASVLSQGSLGNIITNTVTFNFIDPIVSLGVQELKCVEIEKVPRVGEQERMYNAYIFEDSKGVKWFNQYPFFFDSVEGHLHPVSVSNCNRFQILKGIKELSFDGPMRMTESTSFQKHLDNYIGKCTSHGLAVRVQRLKEDIDHLLNQSIYS